MAAFDAELFLSISLGMETTTRSRKAAQSSGRPYRITASNYEILALLQRYRYLPSHYIPALLGWTGEYYKDQLVKLRHEAGAIEYRWPGKDFYRQKSVVYLTRAGEQALKDRGLYQSVRKTGDDFEHELMVCVIRASFEIGAKQHGLELIGPQDILNHATCPPARRFENEPWTIPAVQFKYPKPLQRNKPQDYWDLVEDVETDGEFVGLARRTTTGRSTIIIPGLEADRRTEPLDVEDYERSSIKKKFIKLREVARQGIYASRYGFPSKPSPVVVPVITFNPHQIALARMVERITDGAGSKLFIIKGITNEYEFTGDFPPATGHMLTEDWMMVGRDGQIVPYNILKELGKEVR